MNNWERNYSSYWKCIKSILLSVFVDRKILFSFYFAVICLVIGGISNILLPLVLKNTIEFFSSPSSAPPTLILLSYGLLWIISQSFLHLRSILTYRIEQRITSVLGMKILSHLYTLSQSYFLNQKPGALTNIIRRAQRDVPAIILSFFFHVIPTVIEFLCVIVFISLLYSFFYSLLLSCTLIAFCVYTSLSMKSSLEKRERANEIDQNVDGIVTDWLSNSEAIKVFGKHELAIQTCEEQLKKREFSEVTFMTHFSLSRLGQAFILGCGLISITYFVGQSVLSGELMVGDFVLFNGYILQFIIPVTILGQVTQDIKKALIDMKGIMDILLIESEIREVPHPKRLSNQPYQPLLIEFKNVSFAYKERKILTNLFFTINSGETVLIIGPTGRGKSTIAKLLLRLYDPTEGDILINHINLKKISLQSLSETMGWVPQESYLLNNTIQNNLQFVRPVASLNDLETALDQACLLEFVRKLPHGLQTPVGNRGLKLSGGEKQRLSLARMFLKKPKIGIFDEATSFLDRDTELIIQDNINRFLPQMTKIVITHRPFMMEKADQIITLDHAGISQKNIHGTNSISMLVNKKYNSKNVMLYSN